MESVTVKNFRCFRDEQKVRMAPLTLLVGENSTGKTSFLALLRALWDIGIREVAPDFRESPYDLGSFEDIVYRRDADDGGAADSFEAGFEYQKPIARRENPGYRKVSCQFVFKERRGGIYPVERSVTGKDAWAKTYVEEDGSAIIKFGAPEIEWERSFPNTPTLMEDNGVLSKIFNLVALSAVTVEDGQIAPDKAIPGDKLQSLFALLNTTGLLTRTYAGAPVRSSPKRTYDSVRPSRNPEGEYTPTYLANMSRRDPEEWEIFKSKLEKFGRQSGLFDEIKINSFGDTAGSPFQLHIGKWGKKPKGLTRNLIDVGYGVSQALPLIIELFDPEPTPLFLVQQPEVHLHPSAQAALGTLFCEIAGPERQLVVETHSDNIINRVLMDVRDKTTNLKAEDVSILYFEPNDVDVTIHSLRLDDRGNIINAPPGYRQFFADELWRSVGL